MTDTRCPECGSELRVVQRGDPLMSGLPAKSGVLGEDPALTIAECPECERSWRRAAGSQDKWRAGSNIN